MNEGALGAGSLGLRRLTSIRVQLIISVPGNRDKDDR
jgi:hypothetical protein